mgnify:CR=1 FL=1|tara:strand:+ start:12180 stop:22007 length:9828 start_codon:yes stop_codon:yes gene_type:complete
MRYLDGNTGAIYSQSEVLAQAGEIPFDEFVTSKGYQLMEDAVEETSEDDFTEDVVINSADAASKKTAQTDATDLTLENVSLDSLSKTESQEEINKRKKYDAVNIAIKKYEDYNKDYTFGFGKKQKGTFNESGFLAGSKQTYDENARLQKEMNDELRALGPDFDFPATLYDLDEDEFVDAFRKEYPGISIAQTDAGDGVIVNVNGKDEYLDLQRVLPGENYYKNFDRVLKDIKLMDSEMTSDEVISGITAGVVYQMKDGEYNRHYVNKTLEGTGYSIDQINKQGGKNTGMELLFNGEVVLKDAAVNNSGGKLDSNYIGNEIEEYLKKNLTSAQNEIVANKGYELLDVFLTKQAKEKAKVSDNITEEEVKKAYASKDFIPTVMAVSEGAGLDSIQTDILKTYLQQQQEKAVISSSYNAVAGRTNIGSKKTEIYDYDIATNLGGLSDVEGGDVILDALLTNGIVEQLEETGLVNTKRELVENKMLTISERLLVDTGDVDLIRLAQNYRYAPVERQQDAVNNKIRNIKNVNGEIQEILEKKLDVLIKTLPEGADLNVETSEFEGDVQRVFNLTYNPDTKPTDKEIAQFNTAQVNFYKLQTNVNRLQKDRIKSIHNVIDDINNLPDLNKVTVIEDEDGNEFEVNKNIYDLAFKEYDPVDLIAKDLSDATNQILLTVPTLLGSESALDAQRQLNNKNKYYRSLGTYDDGQGSGGLFTIRTLAQQFPNIALAIGTAGAGSVIGLGSMSTRLAIGTAFGTSSGAQTFRDLTLQQELVTLAYDQKNFLTKGYESGDIDDFSYYSGLLDANQTIAMNDLTDSQIIGASISNGIIEGGITTVLGTAPNTIKIFKDFKGGVNLVDMFGKGKMNQIFGILGEGGKRVGLEVIEEEIIYAGQGIITELAILEREFKGDQFDDIAITTIMVAGGSNGPGIAYSGINNMIYTNEFAKKVNKSNEQLIELNKLIADPTIDPELKSIAIEQMGTEIGVKANAINVNAVDIMAMGEKVVNKVLGFNALKNALYDQAGVRRGTSDVDAVKLIEIYKETLSKEKKESFESQLSTVEQNISKLKDSPKDYDLVIKNLGPIHSIVVDKFNKDNPNWKNNKTKAEQLALVVDDIRARADQDNINTAKKLPWIVEEVESLAKGDLLAENILYANYGRQIGKNAAQALILNRNTELSAEKLLTKEQLAGLEIIPLKDDASNAVEELYKMVENGEIENDAAVEILKSLEEGANGFIVGNKYIVKNEELAKEKLKQGSVRSAVVINHEINHAIDDAYFKNPDGSLSKAGKLFTLYLNDAMTVDGNNVLQDISRRVRNLLDNTDKYGVKNDKGEFILDRKFEDTNDAYKDEYVREVQTLLLAEQKGLEKGESFFGKIGSKLGFGLEIDSSKKALDYILNNNAAFRLGELTEQVKKKIGKSLTSELNVYKKGIEKQSILDDAKPDNKRIFQQTVNTFNDIAGMYGLPLTLKADGTANFTKADWDAVNDETKLGIGVMVGETWTPYVDYLMRSRRDVPGYDEYAKSIVDRAATGVEKRDDGIPFLVKTFNPTKAKLTTYIYGNVRKRLQGVIDKTKGFGEITVDAAPTIVGAKQLVGKEGADSRIKLDERKKRESKKPQPKVPNLINKLKISNLDNSKVVTVKDKTETEIKRKIKQQFLLGSKTEQGSPEFRRELIEEYRADLSNLFISIIKEGLAFDTDAKVKNSNKALNINNFINNNVDEIIRNVTQNIDIANIKYSFLTELILDSDGNKIRKGAEESRSYNDAIEKGNIAGKKIKDIYSGPFKRKAKTITTELRNEFKEYFLSNDINTNKRNARLDSLADVLSEQTGFDLTGEVLREEGLLVEEKIQEIERQISRGKFQISSLNESQQGFWENQRFDFYNDLRLSDNFKWQTINRIHKNIYGEEFTNEMHESISKQFGRLLSPISKSDEQVLGSKKEFNAYLEDIAFSTDINEALAVMVGTTINPDTQKPYKITELSKNKNEILAAREHVIKVLAPYLVDKYNRTLAEDMLLAYSTSFSQGSSFFGAFTKKGNEVIESNKDSNRPSFFGDNTDVLQMMQAINSDIVSIDDKTITYKNETTRKVNINTSANVKKSYIDGKFEDSKELQDKDTLDSGLAWDFTTSVIESLKGVNANTTALVLAAMNGSSNSSLRLAAPVWGRSTTLEFKDLKIPKIRNGKQEYVKEEIINSKGQSEWQFKRDKDNKKIKIYEQAYRYEHAVPARVVLFFMYDSIINGNKDIDLDILKEDYRVTIIPVLKMDNVITDSGFSSMMLAGYLPGKQTWWKRYYNIFTKGRMPYALQAYRDSNSVVGKEFEEAYKNKQKPIVKANAQQTIDQDNNADIAMSEARNSVKYSINEKKIRVFDFDDTLARSNSKVLYTMPDGSTGSLNATQFAKDSAKLQSKGAIFNFDEFSKVVDGKKGPLFDVAKKIQDARGSEDIFVLTARPQSAAGPIQEFLNSMGLNVPLDNITGLEDGTAKAKADWIINKFAEGYNDFYFTDDAIKNVKAVKDALDVLDVKSKVQQARVKFQLDMSEKFNIIIEQNKGVDRNKIYSDVVAKRKGKNQKRFTLFLPPSAEDFRGLTQYTFAGKGKKGEADQDFFDKALIKPYARGVSAMEVEKQQLSNDWRGLVGSFKGMAKKLKSKVTNTEYTFDEAVRVYLWEKAGYTIPGISKRDQAALSKTVREDVDLSAFADGVLLISKKDKYVEPGQYWDGGTIISDLNTISKTINRQEYIKEFVDNANVIFSPENLNKIEAIYGTRVRIALEDSLYRMTNGTNRTSKSKDAIVNRWNNWVNNSVGSIMFFNRRSALLQTLSTVNFINWSDNNPINAAIAFANQPQYWSDFKMLWNSPKLKQRRKGLQGDVQEAEIAKAAKNGGPQGVISYLLKIGFTPTQMADSFAIASGGATFYRNRVNTYVKQGMSKTDAEVKAFEDFSSISEESQQSADPMLISQQQAGPLGRLILAFQNTPMQYTRLMKKAAQDLVAGRGDAKTHISKIIYYGAIQNFIFSALSNALFALIPGFDEDDENLTEEEQIEKYNKVLKSKEDRILNSMMDTLLRGSGLAGAAISTIKNVVRRYNYEEEKGFTADHAYTIIELANLSPPIGSKLRKVYSGIQTNKFEKDVIAERGFSVTLDGKFNLSSKYQVVGDVASGLFNVPLDRLTQEVNALTEALDTRNTAWQRLALTLGFRTWGVNAKNEEHDLIKAAGKVKRKEEGKIKAKETRKLNNIEKAKEAAEKKRLEEIRIAALSVKQRLQETKTKDSLTNIKIEKSIENALLKLDKLMQ